MSEDRSRTYLRLLWMTWLAVGILAVGWFIQNHRTNTLGHSTASTLQAVQDERQRNTLDDCLATNSRHDAAVAALGQVFTLHPTDTPAQRDARRRATTVLINAIVPHTADCHAVTVTKTKSAGSP